MSGISGISCRREVVPPMMTMEKWHWSRWPRGAPHPSRAGGSPV